MSREDVLSEVRNSWHEYRGQREDADSEHRHRIEHLEQEVEDMLWQAMETGMVTAAEIAKYCKANYNTIGNYIRNAKARNGSYK